MSTLRGTPQLRPDRPGPRERGAQAPADRFRDRHPEREDLHQRAPDQPGNRRRQEDRRQETGHPHRHNRTDPRRDRHRREPVRECRRNPAPRPACASSTSVPTTNSTASTETTDSITTQASSEKESTADTSAACPPARRSSPRSPPAAWSAGCPDSPSSRAARGPRPRGSSPWTARPTPRSSPGSRRSLSAVAPARSPLEGVEPVVAGLDVSLDGLRVVSRQLGRRPDRLRQVVRLKDFHDLSVRLGHRTSPAGCSCVETSANRTEGSSSDKGAIRNTAAQTAIHRDFWWPSAGTQLAAHLDSDTAAVTAEGSRLTATRRRGTGNGPPAG